VCKGGRCLELTTLPPSRASNSSNPQGLYTDCFSFYHKTRYWTELKGNLITLRAGILSINSESLLSNTHFHNNLICFYGFFTQVSEINAECEDWIMWIMCPVWIHTRPTTCKPKRQVPQAATICITLELLMKGIMVPETC